MNREDVEEVLYSLGSSILSKLTDYLLANSNFSKTFFGNQFLLTDQKQKLPLSKVFSDDQDLKYLSLL